MEAGVERAKAICYAQGHHEGQLLVRIPKRESVLLKALKDYKRYVTDIRQKLYTAFMAKSGDANLSKNLTAKLLAQYRLEVI